MIEWTTIEYKKWIKKGCKINVKVRKLDISNSNIKSLKKIKGLPNLIYLDC